MKNSLFFLFLLFCVNGFTQSLKGKVVDNQGNPIEYATIYVSEAKSGSITSASGEFILPLKSGKYTCTVQHLSYQTVTKTIEFPQTSFLEITMNLKAVTLKEVQVNAKDEDKAYRIIRNTVAKSPYYQKQLVSYKATFYAKGTMKIKDTPILVGKMLAKQMQIRKGDVYTEESVSEIVVTPDKTEQKVISKRSSYPKTLTFDAGWFFNYNIYRTPANSLISPVTKQGLSVYRYQLEYSYRDNELLIYHIKVMPRNNNPFAFSGYIDIIDGSWHVYNFDFAGSIDLGVAKARFTIKQNYVPIEKNVWMPGSFYTTVDVKTMGFNVIMNTSFSTQYKDYKVNPIVYSSASPVVEEQSPVNKKEPIVSKKSEKLAKGIAEIISQEELKTRDAIKLVNLIEAKNKEDAKNNPKNDSVNSLEIQKHFFMTVDSNALNYDSAQWENYRTIPLSAEELNSFEQKQKNDSIQKEKVPMKKEIKIIKNRDKTFFMGINWMRCVAAYNVVDGFKAGIHLYANKRFKDSATSLNNGVTIGYAFAAKHFFLDAFSQWNYNPKRLASIELFGGKQSADFNQKPKTTYFIIQSGTVSSLFFRKNLRRYYDRIYAGLRHKIELFNGFQTSVGLSYEQQHPIDNHSDYSFFFQKTRTFKPNIPMNEYVAANPAYISAQNAFLLDISISYTPRMFYRYSENKKIKYNVRSEYPTFTLSWKKGINKILGSNSNFDYVELTIKQDIDFRLFKTLEYNFSAGFFPNTKSMHFSNFKHFQTNSFWVVFNPFYEAFNTLLNYTYSTNEWFISGHAKYETLYLMLKFIPGLNKTLMTENLYLSFLSNPLTKNYIEVGYSLSKIYLFGNIGIFVGFNEFKFAAWNIRIGFSGF